MKQTSLWSYLEGVPGLKPATDVVDCFAGAGGFSTGAVQAGHKIIMAIDRDPFLLGCHARNHPGCRHICCELPRDDLPFPLTGDWHLHCSPPCTKLSIMNPLQFPEDRCRAVDLVEWSLRLVIERRPSSWSFEQVNHKHVREQLDLFKKAHPGLCDWGVFDASDFDVPQHRRRIIAGSPFLIQNLRRYRQLRRLSVRDVIPNPPRPFIRNCLYSRPDPHTHEKVAVPIKDQRRSVDEASYSILARGHARWASEDCTVLRHLTAREASLIQGFPHGYALPFRNCVALVAVGNAVPPPVSRVLMQPTKP